MLTIDLEKIVSSINARRQRVRYEFQEIGLMLASKLNDPKHKSLYMKLAKYEEQELLMDALHYVLASRNASGNIGALFMWKLKELKGRPIHPVAIRFQLSKECYFIVGSLRNALRGDMPIALASFREYEKQFPKELEYSGNQLELTHFLETVSPLLKKFKAKGKVVLNNEWQQKGNCPKSISATKGHFMLDKPVLTKREYGRKIHPV